MSMSWDEIAATVAARRNSRGRLLQSMEDVRQRYNGDYAIPLPGYEDEKEIPPVVPFLIAEAIDSPAMRAASVLPSINCPAVDATKETGVRSKEYAKARRRALAYVRSESSWQIARRKAFRHLAGYANTCLAVIPDFKTELPRLVVRDPLGVFPEPKAAEDLTPICNAASVYGKSAEWIAYRYPQAEAMLKGRRFPVGTEVIWDLCEWVDEEDVVIGILGPRIDVPWNDTHSTWPSDGNGSAFQHGMELRRWKNRAGVCTMTMPERVTLDRLASQVANSVGMVDLMAHLMALDVRATERSVFPDRYLVGSQGKVPMVVGGWKEGTSGEANILMDVTSIGELRGTPDPAGRQLQDRLERNMRVSTGLAPQYGGESYGALRTGRGLDTLNGTSIDPRVQELQELIAVHETTLNKITFATFEGYWPTKRYVGFSGWPTDRGEFEFVPSQHIETHNNLVEYPIPGADIQGTTITIGQLHGAGLISKRSAREKHPWVSDAEQEERQLTIEQLDEALLSSFLQRAAQGGIPPADQARIRDLVAEGKTLPQAIAQADKEASERQAAIAPAPPEGMGMAPEAMPGLANPGEGAEMLPPTIGPVNPGLANLHALTNALRAPVRPGG